MCVGVSGQEGLEESGEESKESQVGPALSALLSPRAVSVCRLLSKSGDVF